MRFHGVEDFLWYPGDWLGAWGRGDMAFSLETKEGLGLEEDLEGHLGP